MVWADADGFDNEEVTHNVVDTFLKYYSVTLNNYGTGIVHDQPRPLLSAVRLRQAIKMEELPNP